MPDRTQRERAADGLLPPTPSRAAVRRELGHFLKRLALTAIFLTALLFAGATSFAGFEETSYWNGLQRAFTTISTLGTMGQPTTVGGQITEVAVVTLGVGTLFYLLGTVSELLVTGHLTGLLGAYRMQRRRADLHDHYLICGFGRVGQRVARRLEEAGEPFVVIDANPDVRDEMEEDGVLHVDGQASDDHVLCEAGVDRARAVIACVDSDAENIFVTITARALQPDIEIVARASDESTERKLIRAGANDVISPYKASGDVMARLALDVLGERERATPVDIDDDGRPEGRIATIDPADARTQ
ncbi:MAG: voltage-gated potassium channel [Thermoleophilaceae bacterium]|nr:voltage-gated potassium channel [Thermoleophilaceae bacterium]